MVSFPGRICYERRKSNARDVCFRVLGFLNFLMVSGYNDLVSRIEEEYYSGIQKRNKPEKTELQMLQYQINPHFLYNTLNIVSALAKAKWS